MLVGVDAVFASPLAGKPSLARCLQNPSPTPPHRGEGLTSARGALPLLPGGETCRAQRGDAGDFAASDESAGPLIRRFAPPSPRGGEEGAAPDLAFWEGVRDAMMDYAARVIAGGGRLNHVTRHMVGLFQGFPGARRYRQILSADATQAGGGAGGDRRPPLPRCWRRRPARRRPSRARSGNPPDIKAPAWRAGQAAEQGAARASGKPARETARSSRRAVREGGAGSGRNPLQLRCDPLGAEEPQEIAIFHEVGAGIGRARQGLLARAAGPKNGRAGCRAAAARAGWRRPPPAVRARPDRGSAARPGSTGRRRWFRTAGSFPPAVRRAGPKIRRRRAKADRPAVAAGHDAAAGAAALPAGGRAGRDRAAGCRR